MRWTGVIVGGLAALASVLPLAPAVAATETTRTAPYDYGCLGAPPCAVEVEDARNGHLVHRSQFMVCIGFWFFLVPVPYPCQQQLSTTAGVDVVTETGGTVEVSAVVRAADAVDVAAPVSVCLSLRWGTGAQTWPQFWRNPADCDVVPPAGEVTITRKIEVGGAGQYVAWVHLSDGQLATATVERISYTIIG